MKILLCLIMCLATTAAFGAEIVAKLPGPDGLKTVMLTANDTTLHHVDWEAVNGGGMYEIHGYLEKETVVLTETGWRIDEDIRTDRSSKTVVPITMLPKEVTIGSMKVELVRTENEEAK